LKLKDSYPTNRKCEKLSFYKPSLQGLFNRQLNCRIINNSNKDGTKTYSDANNEIVLPSKLNLENNFGGKNMIIDLKNESNMLFFQKDAIIAHTMRCSITLTSLI